MKIAILGFGSVGQRFAEIFSAAGYEVVIGLQNPQQAQSIEGYPAGSIELAINQSDALALAIPYAAVSQVLSQYKAQLAGKIIIENTNPLNEDWSPLLLGQENSAAEEIARLLPDATVVKAFNTIFADVMAQPQLNGNRITAFIASDDAQAKQKVLTLANNIGYHALDVGPLSCARYLEAMAHLNIQIAVGMKGGTQAAFYYSQMSFKDYNLSTGS